MQSSFYLIIILSYINTQRSLTPQAVHKTEEAPLIARHSAGIPQ